MEKTIKEEEFTTNMNMATFKKKPGPNYKLIENNFKVIEQNMVLVRSQSSEMILYPSRKNRWATFGTSQKPDLQELLNQKTFMRRNSLNPGLVMQVTRISLKKVQNSDFSSSIRQAMVSQRANSIAVTAKK